MALGAFNTRINEIYSTLNDLQRGKYDEVNQIISDLFHRIGIDDIGLQEYFSFQTTLGNLDAATHILKSLASQMLEEDRFADVELIIQAIRGLQAIGFDVLSDLDFTDWLNDTPRFNAQIHAEVDIDILGISLKTSQALRHRGIATIGALVTHLNNPDWIAEMTNILGEDRIQLLREKLVQFKFLAKVEA